MNCTNPVVGKHAAAGKLKLDAGFAYTVIVCVLVAIQPPVDVKVYVIVCVPAPAVDGLKFPAASRSVIKIPLSAISLFFIPYKRKEYGESETLKYF